MSEAGGQSQRHGMFGDLLPQDTSDDRPDPGETDPNERDRWMVENRPPHHDTAW